MGRETYLNEIEIDKLSRRAKLEQVAEECGELGQACMKLVRAEGNGNPCRMSKDDALDCVVEEIADLLLAVDCLLYDLDCEPCLRVDCQQHDPDDGPCFRACKPSIFETVQMIYDQKTDRWVKELRKANGESGEGESS